MAGQAGMCRGEHGRARGWAAGGGGGHLPVRGRDRTVGAGRGKGGQVDAWLHLLRAAAAAGADDGQNLVHGRAVPAAGMPLPAAAAAVLLLPAAILLLPPIVAAAVAAATAAAACRGQQQQLLLSPLARAALRMRAAVAAGRQARGVASLQQAACTCAARAGGVGQRRVGHSQHGDG